MAANRKPKVCSFITATDAFKGGTDTPRAFLERCIESIETQEPQVRAFVVTNLDSARVAADASGKRWKSGKALSLVDGMPVGIKDIMETADMGTEQGSPLFKGWFGRRDAAAVAALREAGAVILGKTVTTEFAAARERGTRNPWDLKRTPGGSSSGSAAAVAAGMVSAALGTQVIGSILRPASFCGCFGYKPSVGGINRGGSFDAFSQSCTGVLAASLGETWIVARAISARAGGDPGYPGILGPLGLPHATKPRRIAILETAGWETATDEAKRAFRDACERIAAAGIEIASRTTDKLVAEVETAISNAYALSMDINAYEGRWPLNTYARDMGRSQLSAHAQERLAAGEAMTQDKYLALIAERQRARETYVALKGQYDVCMTLPATGAAPIGLASTGDPVFAVPASLLGVPSVSLPVLQANGLPLGLQLIGFTGDDASMFTAAAAMIPFFNQ